MKRLLLFLLVAAIVLWIVRDHPTVSGVIDRITSPLLRSHAAVEESEHKRVLSEAVPAIQEGGDVTVATVRVGMSAAEVRDLFGRPDSITEVREGDRPALAWDYRRRGRRVVIVDGRVVSVAIR